jgi:hypothetical protein
VCKSAFPYLVHKLSRLPGKAWDKPAACLLYLAAKSPKLRARMRLRAGAPSFPTPLAGSSDASASACWHSRCGVLPHGHGAHLRPDTC